MNRSDCSDLSTSMDWKNLESIGSLTILFGIDIIVITGNTMVIMAVYYTIRLRSVTNLFIVSLAVADLMVGVAVLPFSAVWEVFKVWIFGDLFCSVWLAVDVWMCTASILNLCAISLDRYVAVTRPVTYPNIMSMRRAKILIGWVWVLSFVICLPPLIGWKDKEIHTSSTIVLLRNAHYANSSMSSLYSTTNLPTVMPPCPWVCELTSDLGYVIYSALGSFYIPMFVMLFFYWRIYKAAIRTTKAINQGFRTTKTLGNELDESRLTLRIHRGRGSSMKQIGNNSSSTSSTLVNSTACSSMDNSPSLRSPEGRIRPASIRRIDRGQGKVKISVSYPSSDGLNMLLNNNSPSGNTATTVTAGSANRSASFSSSSEASKFGNVYVHYTGSETNSIFHSKDHGCHLRVGGGRLSETLFIHNPPEENNMKPRHLSEQFYSVSNKDLSPTPSFEEACSHKPKLISKMGRRNIKSQVKRFRMETKAAKTLGIIVGGFIFCWLPFFTLYLVRAFCNSCVSPTLFSVMFWLGYCNSALNPMIYALFSPDFRAAFQRIIYSCFSKKVSLRDSRSARRGSDGSQLAINRRTDRSSSYNDFPMTNINPCNIQSENEQVLSENV